MLSRLRTPNARFEFFLQPSLNHRRQQTDQYVLVNVILNAVGLWIGVDVDALVRGQPFYL